MTITFTPRPIRKGSTQRQIDVEKDGKPYGTLWTFRNTRTTWHPWHALPLDGQHKVFYNATQTGGDLKAAKAYMTARAEGLVWDEQDQKWVRV